MEHYVGPSLVTGLTNWKGGEQPDEKGLLYKAGGGRGVILSSVSEKVRSVRQAEGNG